MKFNFAAKSCRNQKSWLSTHSWHKHSYSVWFFMKSSIWPLDKNRINVITSAFQVNTVKYELIVFPIQNDCTKKSNKIGSKCKTFIRKVHRILFLLCLDISASICFLVVVYFTADNMYTMYRCSWFSRMFSNMFCVLWEISAENETNKFPG